MRSARWLLVGGVMLLVGSGILLDYQDGFFSGLLLAFGLGAVAGSLHAFLGGVNGQ